ncbi:hypothetical protein FACS1894208_09230 [Clostridia bacterium]|nr:hypothetical protein FACS1894208_09230 [Clostridia bacterium]
MTHERLKEYLREYQPINAEVLRFNRALRESMGFDTVGEMDDKSRKKYNKEKKYIRQELMLALELGKLDTSKLSERYILVQIPDYDHSYYYEMLFEFYKDYLDNFKSEKAHIVTDEKKTDLTKLKEVCALFEYIGGMSDFRFNIKESGDE